MIDLMAIANKTDKAYVDVECSFGKIRVYHVPDAVLLSGEGSGYNEPESPTVTMKTAVGNQERPAKKGDPEYSEWQRELAAYREHTFAIRQARGLVLAIQDINWTEYDLDSPPPVKIAQDVFSNGNWPQDVILRKQAWLDFTIFSKREDKSKVLEAIALMNSEPSEDDIEEVKKNSE